ncbi:AAA family ATPase (plasmid) [Brevibacillus laterosporus]|uniref:AAA family ATPase n=1 Tax=Brevibacillus laterosporus TaxID=1465 RepID=A0A518V1V5_BRELA|nr:AAA family ATPase [Brevibacillus laterosporus]
MVNAIQKINDLRDYLSYKFVEREEIVEGILLAILAKQHVLLVGPPGTAKSNLVSELAKHITGGNYFQWLLSRFSTPEELFGPVSLQGLEKGIYKRNTLNKLPESHIAFIDEIFKSNSAILNAMLTLINERIFYNDGQPITSPLMTVVGASNEYPEDGENLEALFDRFLLRYHVDYIGEDNHFISMLKGISPKSPMPLSINEITELQLYTAMVNIPNSVLEVLLQIRNKLKDEGIRPSDRRFKQSLNIIRANAFLKQRNTVEYSDLAVLSHSLWETVDQSEKVKVIVKEFCTDKLKFQLDQYFNDANEQFEIVRKQQTAESALEATKKMKDILHSISLLKPQYPARVNECEEVEKKVKIALSKVAEAAIGI